MEGNDLRAFHSCQGFGQRLDLCSCRVHLAFDLKEFLAAVSDCIDQAIHLSLRGSQLSLKPCPISPLLAIAARAFLVIFANKQFHGFRIEQAFLDSG